MAGHRRGPLFSTKNVHFKENDEFLFACSDGIFRLNIFLVEAAV